MAQKISRRAIADVVAAQLLGGVSTPSAIMQSLAAYLIANKISDQAALIMNDVASAIQQRSGLLTVEVSSARKLSDDAKVKLTQYLKKVESAKNVTLYEIEDPTLLGGIIARTANAEIDVSIRNKLRQLTAIA